MNKIRFRHVAVLFTALFQLVSSPLSAQFTNFDAGYYVQGDPIYFLPARFTFGVWGLIITGMILYSIYQILPNQRERKIHKVVGWPMALMNFFFTAWLVAASLETVNDSLVNFSFIATVVVIVLMLLTLIYLFINTQIKNQDIFETPVDDLIVSFPLMNYFAWICIATIANVTDSLYGFGFTGNGSGELWALLVIAVAAIVVSGILILGKRAAGLSAYTLVIMWATYGLYYRNWGVSGQVAYAALGLLIYSFALFMYKVWVSYK
ncbi:hypothetical protein KC678_04635 [Candidatus Dojkabacteria bacterium]|uniref:Tryptophan-rich sensory protein n=1 Tax=Candidatus Dojkabacteria bacterium TaxID=2099670 RepID=A0A955L277_9BACT|nr:hypothetical protein [Candidatus Dojkabacteria bacterium]